MDLAVGVVVLACGVWLCSARTVPGVALVLAGLAWFAANVGLEQLVFVHRGLVVAAALLLSQRRSAALVAVASTVPADWMSPPLVALGWAVAMGGLALTVARQDHRLARAAAVCAMPLVVAVVSIDTAVARDVGAVAVYDVGTAVSAIVVAVVGHRLATSSTRITDAVVQVALGRTGSAREQLARALRDPRVDVAFVQGSGWIDEVGRPRERVPQAAGRRRMPVRVGDEVVAEIACREDLARTATTVAAIERATVLAAANARLRADVRSEAREIDRSRSRLLTVEDEARASVARRLRTGVRAPLEALARPDNGVDEVLRELDRLAAGLGPGALEHGFDLAMQRLVQGTPAELDLGGVVPARVETTAYLVAAEALTNSLRHAGATRIQIATRDDHIEVTDDGRGGATGGLHRLADRASAAGGRLEVSSPPGGGTSVVMWF